MWVWQRLKNHTQLMVGDFLYNLLIIINYLKRNEKKHCCTEMIHMKVENGLFLYVYMQLNSTVTVLYNEDLYLSNTDIYTDLSVSEMLLVSVFCSCLEAI